MPNKVEDVRFSIERVLSGGMLSLAFTSDWDILLGSRDGVGTAEDSDEAGVISKARRGVGRKIWGCSMADMLLAKVQDGAEGCVERGLFTSRPVLMSYQRGD